MRRVRLLLILILAMQASPVLSDSPSLLARKIAALSADVLNEEQQEEFDEQTFRNLRARGDEVNRQDVAKWRAIRSREDWERWRDESLVNFRKSLGKFPDLPKSLNVRVTKTLDGDGFLIDNLVYQSRPGIWVTANLYKPAKPTENMPGILIAHSHHRPKTQGELQDMGMTWARQGCLVLVIDQLGHGERADHPFQSEQDYKADPDFKWWRQDYYFRFNTNAQLDLVGESLMGWMVWDLMRGVDLLLAHPGVDSDKIILLGAVAGGGDPAGVTAALDKRIAAAVPFNFGGPQPETRFPLPEDADLHFNYLSGAYWESTRNLRGTGEGGFLHWLIVGSIAPRKLIYAHEFAWDRERDPVWKRLNTLYGFYDEPDGIDYTLGRGSVKGRPPEATHCTNIGRHHRQRIHAAFARWFGINVSPDDEYSEQMEARQLLSMTEEARVELKPQKLFEVLSHRADTQLRSAHVGLEKMKAVERREQLQSKWKELLGEIEPRERIQELSRKSELLPGSEILVERVVLQTEPEFILPLMLLVPQQKEQSGSPIVVAVSQSGMSGFLRHRSAEIAKLLAEGATVCLLNVRDAGKSRGDHGAGGNGSTSFYALYFETPMLGYRLRDLRATLKYLRTREDLNVQNFALWGDSFAPANPAETNFQVPWRVSGRPKFSEPLGGLLALMGALFESDVQAVYVQGGLSAYASILKSPYNYVPHDVIVPGVLTVGDLPDLVAALPPCSVRLHGLVDGLNRRSSKEEVHATYAPAVKSFQKSNQASLQLTSGEFSPAEWFLQLNTEK